MWIELDDVGTESDVKHGR